MRPLTSRLQSGHRGIHFSTWWGFSVYNAAQRMIHSPWGATQAPWFGLTTNLLLIWPSLTVFLCFCTFSFLWLNFFFFFFNLQLKSRLSLASPQRVASWRPSSSRSRIQLNFYPKIQIRFLSPSLALHWLLSSEPPDPHCHELWTYAWVSMRKVITLSPVTHVWVFENTFLNCRHCVHTRGFKCFISRQLRSFFKNFLIAGSLLCRIWLFTVKSQHESAIGIHISPPSWTSLPPPSPSCPSRLIQSPCLSFLETYSRDSWRPLRHFSNVHPSQCVNEFGNTRACPDVVTVFMQKAPNLF